VGQKRIYFPPSSDTDAKGSRACDGDVSGECDADGACDVSGDLAVLTPIFPFAACALLSRHICRQVPASTALHTNVSFLYHLTAMYFGCLWNWEFFPIAWTRRYRL
jgi:hypothetical protein